LISSKRLTKYYDDHVNNKDNPHEVSAGLQSDQLVTEITHQGDYYLKDLLKGVVNLGYSSSDWGITRSSAIEFDADGNLHTVIYDDVADQAKIIKLDIEKDEVLKKWEFAISNMIKGILPFKNYIYFWDYIRNIYKLDKETLEMTLVAEYADLITGPGYGEIKDMLYISEKDNILVSYEYDYQGYASFAEFDRDFNLIREQEVYNDVPQTFKMSGMFREGDYIYCINVNETGDTSEKGLLKYRYKNLTLQKEYLGLDVLNAIEFDEVLSDSTTPLYTRSSAYLNGFLYTKIYSGHILNTMHIAKIKPPRF
jgi:hypothetical protein